jgi:hypothetical protein
MANFELRISNSLPFSIGSASADIFPFRAAGKKRSSAYVLLDETLS